MSFRAFAGVFVGLIFAGTVGGVPDVHRDRPQRPDLDNFLNARDEASMRQIVGEYALHDHKRDRTMEAVARFRTRELVREDSNMRERTRRDARQSNNARGSKSGEGSASSSGSSKSGSGSTKSGKGGKGGEVKDPCAPVVGKGGKESLPRGCDPPRGVCPGEENPSKPGEYMIDGEFTKPNDGELIQPCNGHGRTNRVDGECTCLCDEGYGGGSPNKDCSVRWRELMVVDIDCNNMEDAYMGKCLEVTSTMCKPYSLVWRFECVRMCKSIVGRSCKKEDIVQHCKHAPECPSMCVSMMDMNCKAQVKKMLSSIPGLEPP